MYQRILQKYLAIKNKILLDRILMKSCQNLCKSNMIIFFSLGDKELHGLMSIKLDLFLQ